MEVPELKLLNVPRAFEDVIGGLLHGLLVGDD